MIRFAVTSACISVKTFRGSPDESSSLLKGAQRAPFRGRGLVLERGNLAAQLRKGLRCRHDLVEEQKYRWVEFSKVNTDDYVVCSCPATLARGNYIGKARATMPSRFHVVEIAVLLQAAAEVPSNSLKTLSSRKTRWY